MPEWYLVIGGLAGLVALDIIWPFLHLGPILLILLVLSLAAPIAQAVIAAAQASFTSEVRSPLHRAKLVAVTASLHLLQPLARLVGRVRHGLSPWRLRRPPMLAFPRPRRYVLWSERWQAAEARLAALEATLRAERVPALRGGNFDRWDLAVRGGLFGAAGLLMAVEDHGAGQQYVRFKLWPRWSGAGLCALAAIALLAAAAALEGALVVGGVLGTVALAGAVRALREAAAALGALVSGIEAVGATSEE